MALAAALALEAIRRVRIGQLRKELADADDQAVVNISVNGVEVGAIPEPVFLNMKLVVANDARKARKTAAAFARCARRVFHRFCWQGCGEHHGEQARIRL